MTMPNDNIYANQCTFRSNHVITKMIYEDLIFNLNVVYPELRETTYPAND
jgi:hypothetical protein